MLKYNPHQKKCYIHPTKHNWGDVGGGGGGEGVTYGINMHLCTFIAASD